MRGNFNIFFGIRSRILSFVTYAALYIVQTSEWRFVLKKHLTVKDDDLVSVLCVLGEFSMTNRACIRDQRKNVEDSQYMKAITDVILSSKKRAGKKSAIYTPMQQ